MREKERRGESERERWEKRREDREKISLSRQKQEDKKTETYLNIGPKVSADIFLLIWSC